LLVSLCVEDEVLQDKAVEIAERLAAGAPSAIRWTKNTLNNWYRMMGPAFDASTALEMLGFAGSEVREGLATHLEKRKPVFDPKSPVSGVLTGVGPCHHVLCRWLLCDRAEHRFGAGHSPAPVTGLTPSNGKTPGSTTVTRGCSAAANANFNHTGNEAPGWRYTLQLTADL
jgi:hypothetical protein